MRLADRLRGAIGSRIALQCSGAGQVAGELVDVGPDWLLLVDDLGRDLLCAAGAVRSVAGLTRRTGVAEDGRAVVSAWDMRRALRALARDRAAVQLVLDDGGVLSGTLDRVGADYVELAEHAVDAPRRAETVEGVRAVVLGTITLVRTVTPGI